jgi:hypothetical protein
MSSGERPLTIESRVDDTSARYPSTGPLFLQTESRASPRQIATMYPGPTLGEYAALNSLSIERLLASLNAAAEADQFAPRTASVSLSSGAESGWRARSTPPIGAIGYTGSYREPSGDVGEVSVVSVLEARGPD